MPNVTCPACKFPALPADAHFCPNCGVKLNAEISMSQQIGLYALSFFLPPFGIIPAIKYLRQPTQKAKTIGIVAIILTVLSIVITVLSISTVMNMYSQTISQLDNLSNF